MGDEKEKKEREAEEAARPGAAPGGDGDAAAELASLREAAAKAVEYLDLARRTKAEFVNWQARARREGEDLRRYAVESFARELLPALDGLDHTLALRAQSEEGRPIHEGVALVQRELLRILAKVRIRPIETAGKSFDPLYHEAVEALETADLPDGTILEETRRGYLMHDRVLRPAQVKIARASSGRPSGDDGNSGAEEA